MKTEQLTKIYSDEIWLYNKKAIRLGDMKDYQLDQALNYLKKYPQGKQYGKLKSHWVEAISHIIKVRSNKTINDMLKYIKSNQLIKVEEKVDNIINNFDKKSKDNYEKFELNYKRDNGRY